MDLLASTRHGSRVCIHLQLHPQGRRCRGGLWSSLCVRARATREMLSVCFASTNERVEFTINHFQGILRGSSSRKESATGMLTVGKAKRAESRGDCCHIYLDSIH